MQAVDELVADVVQALEQEGQLDNTYLFFTSDNGFHVGEHRLPPGKGTIYEEDIHVPLLVRGPGIQPNTTIDDIVANIDIAPTIMDLARTETVSFVDGRSLVPFLGSRPAPDAAWRKALLIEMGSMDPASPPASAAGSASQPQTLEFPDSGSGNDTLQISPVGFRGIRGSTFVYVEHNTGEIEYYNLTLDPYELNNVAPNIDPAVLSALHGWLLKLDTCAGADCRRLEEHLPAQ
jgi:hypothetical protein